MSDEDSEAHPIKAPLHGHPDDKVRGVVEAGIQLIPGGGSIARLARDLIPSQAEKARRKWEGEVSDRTNEHGGRLDEHDKFIRPKTATLSGASVKLAVALAKAPGDGMRGRGLTLDDLMALLPDEERQAVHDAVFDLESLGLVKIDRAIGKHWWLYLTQSFYEQMDHQVMNWNTQDDARTLAKLLLEDDAREATSKLHEASSWEKRRFNPAFSVLLNEIPEERSSKEIQPNYPSAYVMLLPEDRARLKRFAASD